MAARLRLPPSWTLLMGVAGAAGVSAWRALGAPAAAEPAFLLRSLLWPGGAIFLAVYCFAWLGWALDID